MITGTQTDPIELVGLLSACGGINFGLVEASVAKFKDRHTEEHTDGRAA